MDELSCVHTRISFGRKDLALHLSRLVRWLCTIQQGERACYFRKNGRTQRSPSRLRRCSQSRQRRCLTSSTFTLRHSLHSRILLIGVGQLCLPLSVPRRASGETRDRNAGCILFAARLREAMIAARFALSACFEGLQKAFSINSLEENIAANVGSVLALSSVRVAARDFSHHNRCVS